MSYVPNFVNDVFVSYSTIDNEVIVVDGKEQRGWVDVLLEKLRMELKPRLGVRDIRFFMDHEVMRSNLPITSQLLEAVRSSAVLLVVMSPSYLRSEWCRRERNAFLSVVKDRVATGSMLVIRARPVGPDEQPDEFRDLRGIDFFKKDSDSKSPRLLGCSDANEQDFINRIMTLSGELAEQLTRLRNEAGRTSVPRLPSGERVFVATATDDLEEREMEIRNYLQQAGLQVLPSPQSKYPTTDLATYEAAVLHDLESCSVFAQVLGQTRGRELDFAPGKRLPALQCELARRAQKPVLQWRERSLAFDNVQDPEYRALLADALACGFEEFKRAVVERARQKPPPERQRSPQVVVFVNADAPDRLLARELGQALAGFGVDCYWPIEEGSPEDIRKDLEENLQSCDGLVLVYGKTRSLWVQSQLRQARKMLSTRDRPLAMMAIFKGPPPEKTEIPAAMPNLMMLDCAKGVESDEIRKFVSKLQA